MTKTELLDRERLLMSQDVELSRQFRMMSRNTGIYVVVEDDESIQQLLSILIKTRGRTAVAFSDADTASDYINKHSKESIACCIVDLNLHHTNGEKLVDWLEEKHRDIPVLVYTGDAIRGTNVKSKYPWINVLFKGRNHSIRTLMNALGLRDVDGPALMTG